MRILRAYCIELGRSVTADEARREYLSRDNPPSEFHFFCESAACVSQEKKVRISCANYRKFASEGTKFVTTYFRRWDDHTPSCYYFDTGNENNDQQPDKDGNRKRRISKETDFVDEFDPRPEKERPSAGNTSRTTSKTEPNEDRTKDVFSKNDNRGKNKTRTIFLEKLVDTYEEARQKLPREEFFSLKVRLTGIGNVLVHKYFKHISQASLDGSRKVYFGKAKFDDWFGKGFRLKFIDKINGFPVCLYVSKDLLKEYQYKNYLIEMLKQACRQETFQTYALGYFSMAPSRKSIDFKIEDPRHLTFLT